MIETTKVDKKDDALLETGSVLVGPLGDFGGGSPTASKSSAIRFTLTVTV